MHGQQNKKYNSDYQRIYKEALALNGPATAFSWREKKKTYCPIAMTQSKFTTALAERHYCVVHTNVKEMTEPWNQTLPFAKQVLRLACVELYSTFRMKVHREMRTFIMLAQLLYLIPELRSCFVFSLILTI